MYLTHGGRKRTPADVPSEGERKSDQGQWHHLPPIPPPPTFNRSSHVPFTRRGRGRPLPRRISHAKMRARASGGSAWQEKELSQCALATNNGMGHSSPTSAPSLWERAFLPSERVEEAPPRRIVHPSACTPSAVGGSGKGHLESSQHGIRVGGVMRVPPLPMNWHVAVHSPVSLRHHDRTGGPSSSR